MTISKLHFPLFSLRNIFDWVSQRVDDSDASNDIESYHDGDDDKFLKSHYDI